jgi:ABC-2 type transport system ATP-binding protein
VLYTTHYMEEAQELCDRLAIMDRGRIAAQGTLAELRALLGERDMVRLAGRFDRGRVVEALAALGDIEVVQADDGRLTLAVAGGTRRLPAILSAVAGAGGEVRETVLAQPSLESLFIKLTGTELRE